MAAPTLGATDSVSGFANPQATPGVTTAATGSSFLLSFITGSGTTITSVTDSKGNTWSLLASIVESNNGTQLWVYYTENGAGGASHTVSVSASGNAGNMFFAEVLGAASSSIVDVSNTAFDNSGTPFNCAVTTLTADTLALSFAHAGGGSGGAYTFNGGFTKQAEFSASNTTAWGSRSAATAGSYDPAITHSVIGNNFAIITLAIKPAAGASYSLTADSGSYTLTGQAAGLTYAASGGNAWFDLTIDAEAWFDADIQTAYWWSTELPVVPNAAVTGYSLTAAQGSYALSGQAAALRAARKLTAAQGSYTLTGQAAGLKRGLILAAAQGSYSHTGQAVALTASRKLAAAQGSYTLTGQATGLRGGRVVAAGQGSYSLTGQAAALTYGGGAKVLTAGQGSYSLTGQAATLRATRTLGAAQGSYSHTGQAVALKAGRKLAAAQGSYSLTGQAAGLLATRNISLAAGGYTLTGQSITLRAARMLAAAAGSYSLTGQDAALDYQPIVGAFTVVATPGSYTLTGFDVGFAYGRRTLGPRPGGPRSAGAARPAAASASRTGSTSRTRSSNR